MFYTNILQFLKSGRYYIGHTLDLGARLKKHQLGKVTALKDKEPWKLFIQNIS